MAEAQGRADALEEQKTDWEDPAKQEQMAAVRQEIVATALHADFKLDDLKGKTNSEIKKMVVAQRWPNLKVDELEPGYVEGRFGTVQDEAEVEGENLEKLQNLGNATNQRRDDKPGDKNDEDLTYRQLAQQKTDGMHLKTEAEMREVGLS